MAVTKIRGNTQIIAGTITNTEIAASANIATSKLADGALFIKSDGSVAFAADQSMGNFKLTNLAAPVSANDAARLADVQAATAGLDVKASVRVASTANLDPSTDLEDGDTVDGVLLATGDRVLLKDQTDASENGIYVVPASGAASRAADFVNPYVSPNAFVFVEEGTANADSGWVLITDGSIDVGTDDLDFTAFFGSGASVTASNLGGGAQVFKQKVANDLQFRSLSQGSGKVTVTQNANDISFDIGAGTLVNADINASAAIARSKLAAGSANHVVINDGSGNFSSEAQLAVSRGGTNSGAALNNNRVMVSSGGAIVEAAAITAARALISDANGIPTHSAVTATELGYLSGVTSAIQTQLDARVEESKYIRREVPSGAINGSNVTFTLANTPLAGKEDVFLNGLLQNAGGGNDYTISGDTITYNSAPQTGDILLVSYIY